MITLEAIDKLKDELGRIFTMAKTHHYTQVWPSGKCNSQKQVQACHPQHHLDPHVPTNPGAYSADALSASNVAAMCEQFMAQHKIKQKSYRDCLNVKEAGKELILYTVGNDAVAQLKKQYIGFGDTTVIAMINYLHLKTAIRMTTAQKYKYKRRAGTTLLGTQQQASQRTSRYSITSKSCLAIVES
jgi:hypothetical protein